MRRPGSLTWPAAAGFLAAAFVFRVAYGLSMPFWFEDERQVYLIGLRSFARGAWPYFGADVVWSGGQVPGALLGWLVRGPLTLLPMPEAPLLLLNILSFGALLLLTWYLSARVPGAPRWLIAVMLLTCPWTLNFSTHVVNPSYVLAGAIVFFVGFLEGLPAMRRGLVPFTAAWAAMGAGLLWVMQLHMSWVLLPPYVALAAAGVAFGRLDEVRSSRMAALARAALGCAIGAAVTGSLLVPTILRHGLGAGHVDDAVSLHAQNPLELLTTAARVLSFASFEINRFLGTSRAERVLMLWRQPWMTPFVVVMLAASLAHPVWMAVTAFRRVAPDRAREWRQVRGLAAGTIVLIYGSYFGSVRGPQAHSFYLAFPVSALFAASCWQAAMGRPGAARRRWERVAVVVVACGVVTHAGLALDRWPRQSLYTDRPLVTAAIAHRNDRYLGDRRDTIDAAEDHRPRPGDGVADPEAWLAARATADLRIVSSSWAPVAGRVSRFSITVENRSREVAWLDLRYAATFTDASARVVAVRDGVIKQLLQPGATRQWLDVADGDVPDGATAATIALTGAERAIPVARR